MRNLPPDIRIIAVGASAGGVTAIQNLLADLPPDFKVPIVFVQHLPADMTIDPALVFSRHFRGPIFEALDKMPIESGHIYFAPPGYHLSIERDLSFSLSQDDPVHFARPSIDVFFESVANNVGAKSCGVLLTGANGDGAHGLKMIQGCGGYTIVQDPKTAEVASMPKAAIDIMKPDSIGTLAEISRQLATIGERAIP